MLNIANFQMQGECHLLRHSRIYPGFLFWDVWQAESLVPPLGIADMPGDQAMEP